MHTIRQMTVAIALACIGFLAFSPEAHAECRKLGYSVNDYGKEGPTRDAKALLDTYIKSWTAERGIKSYRVGKKSVSCELYLDVIVFDEHTCTATASVCW